MLDTEQRLYVPAGCESIRYFAPLTSTVWSYVLARRESTADRLAADIHIINEDGSVAAELLGTAFAPLGSEAYWTMPRATERALCDVQWVREEARVSASSSAPGSVLLIGEREGSEVLARALGKAGVRVAAIDGGPHLRRRLTERIEGLTADGRPTHVISLLALDNDIESQCAGALETLQTLAESVDHVAGRSWFVTRGAWPIDGSPGSDVAHAAIWGLVRTAALEHPELAPSLLDLDPRDSVDALYPFVDLLREGGSSEQLALRRGRLYSPRLRPFAHKPSAQPDLNPFAGDGSFLITGAFGGLGGRLAEWIVQRGGRRLVMVGRRLPELAQSRIAALRTLGAEVMPILSDLSSEDAVRTVIERIPPAFQPLRGVFHLALELADASMLNQTVESLRRPLRSKADIAMYLHRATEALPIEHFVLFSSVLSVLGGPGQANYTAACAAVEGLALERRALGLPALAIGWGPWAFAGSAGLDAVERRHSFSAMYPMPEAAGFSILESLLCSDAAAVAVAAFDYREWQRVYGRSSRILDRIEPAAPRVSTSNRWRSAVRGAPPEQRVQAIEEYLTRELGARARTADPITLDEPTANYAIDSLAMLEVRSHISDDLGVLVPPSVFLDNPTIRLLARALAARMTAREAGAEEHERLADTLHHIDRLSDGEVEATLARLSRDVAGQELSS
jgi:hypothetical protein